MARLFATTFRISPASCRRRSRPSFTASARVFAAVAALGAAATCLGQDEPYEKERIEWNAPGKPARIYGNTYYVGPAGLSSILITSDQGHVLIDGALPESAPGIAANIRTLGFRVEDVKLILNSHAHFDHAGGIAELQKLSGAAVAASPWSAQVLEAGASPRDDPQFGQLPTMAKVAKVQVLRDGETLRVGPLALTAHFTPGHTRGGTSWSWSACERQACRNMVYADSLSPISAAGFRFTASTEYPQAVADFEKSYRTLESLPCDMMLTPHPQIARSITSSPACSAYAASQRASLQRRIAEENGKL
jgi:metallo-beta-lactamase class B